MPYTEAQKRANKKWREANREHYLEGVKKWKEAQPDFYHKNLEYVRKYQRKQTINKEFKVLCSIDIQEIFKPPKL